MRDLIKYLLVIAILSSSKSIFSQWRSGAGAGFAYLSDVGSKTHKIYEGSNIYNFNIPVSLYYKPSWSYFIEFPSSYQLKRNLFILKPQILYNQVNEVNNYHINQIDNHHLNTPIIWSSNMRYNMMGFQIPFCYGFSVIDSKKKFNLFPYIGISNNFIWTASRNEVWANIHINEDSKDHSKSPNIGGSSDMTYSLLTMVGFRFRFYGVYVDLFYNRQIYQKDQSNSDATFQSFNLSIGYVYTFKQHENKNKAIE